MRTYLFGDIPKTLKKNTFELEEIVKDAIGVNDKNEKKMIAIQKEFLQLQKEFAGKVSRKRRIEIQDRLAEINSFVLDMEKSLKWSNSFDNCIKVVNILFVEGATGLDKKNFGRFDAEQAWKDFFTAPTENDQD